MGTCAAQTNGDVPGALKNEIGNYLYLADAVVSGGGQEGIATRRHKPGAFQAKLALPQSILEIDFQSIRLLLCMQEKFLGFSDLRSCWQFCVKKLKLQFHGPGDSVQGSEGTCLTMRLSNIYKDLDAIHPHTNMVQEVLFSDICQFA